MLDSRCFRIALLACTAGLVTPVAAAPAPAQDAGEPAPAAQPAPLPLRQDLAALSVLLESERREIGTDGAAFPVFVKPITGGPAKGAVLLVPGDGEYPGAAPGLEQLRHALPAHGWSTWLISLESPPRVRSDHLAATASSAAGPAPAAPPAAPAAPGKDAGNAAPAAASETAAAPVASASEQARRAEQQQAWAARARARIAEVAQAARSEGTVVLVAEGSAAALLTGLLGEQPALANAAILLDPVDLAGLDSAWPEKFATPVLELFDPAARRAHGASRRERANALGLRYYRQITIASAGWSEQRDESLLARRVRGWLSSLDLPAPPPPAGG